MQNSISRVKRLCFHITQSVLFVLVQGCIKTTDIQFKRNKSIPLYSWIYNEVTPLCLKWNQIWKKPHQKMYSDQLRLDEQDTDCFEHMHEENRKLSVN